MSLWLDVCTRSKQQEVYYNVCVYSSRITLCLRYARHYIVVMSTKDAE